jgi:hypothetical protein
VPPWLVVFLPLLLCAGVDPPPTSEMELLGRIQQRMGMNLERLPGHACLATVERSIRQRSGKKLLVRDRIRVEVAVAGFDETFAWPGSGRFAPAAALQVAPGGAGGIGGWGAWSRRVFRSASPGFTHAGDCAVDGRRGVRYDFQVPWSASAYTVPVGGKQMVVPYAGSICADPGSLDVMRLEVRGDVGKLPLAAVSETIDYARVPIGAGEFLLPQSHELVMTDLEGNEGRNTTTLSACRPFSPGQPVPVAAATAEERRLPARLSLEMKLETQIIFEKSAVGDPVSARLSRGIRAAGISVPKGAVVSGRIRRIEERYQPGKHYMVGLEFSTLTFGDAHASFRARLVGPALRYNRRPDSADQRTLYNPPAPIIDITGLEIDDSDPSSPFGVFRVRTPKLNLAPGMKMIWETQGE